MGEIDSDNERLPLMDSNESLIRYRHLNVDEALEVTGSYGAFQLAIQLVSLYTAVFICFQPVLSLFIGDDPPWICVRNNTGPFCEKNFGVQISSHNANFSQRCHLDASEWTYSRDKKHSYVTEFNLVCEKIITGAITSAIFHIGGFASLPITGFLSDRYGRKPTLIAYLMSSVVFSVGCSFVPSVAYLLAFRFCLGACIWASVQSGIVYLGEFILPTHRAMSYNMNCMAFTFSSLIIVVTAYFVQEWRKLQLYSSFPVLLGIACLFAIPESPRWLWMNGKTSKAEEILQKIGKFNSCPVLISLQRAETKKYKYTLIDVITNKKAMHLIGALGFIMLSVSMCFYVISFESSNLGGSMYQTFALFAVVEFPSNFLTTFLCNKYGRKRSILISLIAGSLFAGCCAMIPPNITHHYIINMALLMSSKFFITISFLACLLWAFELLPTVVRLQTFGICYTLEKLGIFTTPFVTTALQRFNSRLPYIIVVCFTLLPAAVGLSLPETNKKATREKFEDFVEESCDAKVGESD